MPSLIEIQLDALFTRNAYGRLLATRGPYRPPVPRVFLGRSSDGNALVLHRDVDAGAGAEFWRRLSASRHYL